MSRPLRLLVIEDSEDDAKLLVAELRRAGYTPEWERVQKADSLRTALAQPWDLILADYSMPDFDAVRALEMVQATQQDIPFIVVSGSIGEDIAVAMMKKGAQDFLLKQDLRRFVPAVERELREAKNRHQQRLAELQVLKAHRAIEQTADHILITDRAGVIEYANPALLARTGFALEELIGHTPRVLKSGKQPDTFYETLWKTILAGQSFHGQFINRCKNGELFHEEKTISPLTDAQGRITHFVSTGMDITVRKQAEDKVQEQAALLDKAHDAIYVTDMQGVVTFWNQGAERLTGWTAAEAIGQTIVTLLFRGMRTPQLKEAAQVTCKDGEWVGELEEYHKNGKSITVQSRSTLILDEECRPKSILVIDTDITEKKKLEAQFLRAQRMETVGTLAGGIAHDLNNMLAPLLVSVQLLKEKITDDEGQGILEMLEHTVHRGADLVQQVLAFGRGLQGRRAQLQPGRLVREIAHVIRETFPKSIEFESRLAPDIHPIVGDPTQIHQVLLNLCINARDAMPHGGKLSLCIENVMLDEPSARLHAEARPGPYVCFEVADTGTGIPKEIQEKIFDPFFTTKEPGKGTGLGLSTSLGIVKSHGGFINCYSESGRGSVFKVYVPADAAPLAADTAGGTAPRLPRGHNELILVVDDEETIRRIVQRTLEVHGYRVVTAGNGAEAVSIYTRRQHAIDVVFTDMAMPIMDGPATIIALKSINPDVRIIASSGFPNQEDLAKTAMSVCCFIPKPYTAEAMLQALHDVLHLPA